MKEASHIADGDHAGVSVESISKYICDFLDYYYVQCDEFPPQIVFKVYRSMKEIATFIESELYYDPYSIILSRMPFRERWLEYAYQKTQGEE